MTTPRHRHQDGVALIVALMLGIVAILLSVALLAFADRSEPVARDTQDWNAAYAAAEAGLDDFLFRLSRDPEYWQRSDTNPPDDGNTAFDEFVAVPGSANAGRYTYKVTQRPDPTRGANIILEVTGKVRGEERALRTHIRRRGFIDYLYFTEFEGMDPALASNPASYESLCARHWYDVPAPDPSCLRIVFGSQDTINGPLHSNDQIMVSGTPTFNGDVSTSWNPSPIPSPPGGRWAVWGSAMPNFTRAGDPAYDPPLGMPDSNGALRQLADKYQGGKGCTYTGPTKITLKSTGRMEVVSPQTDDDDLNPGCGPVGPGSDLTLPVNGVLSVQNKVASTTNPYYVARCSMAQLPVPIPGDIANTSPALNYTCDKGDAFVSGVLKGRLTITAENRIVVIDDLTLASPPTNPSTTDSLGLVANNFVETFHPVASCTNEGVSGCHQGGRNINLSWNGNAPLVDLKIHAAILSLTHSFRVQSYKMGASLGTLTIVGAIAQRYRGIVRYSATPSGYGKDYNYDSRLKVSAPPHFMNPVQSAWKAVAQAELK